MVLEQNKVILKEHTVIKPIKSTPSKHENYFQSLKKNLSIKIINISDQEIEFDILGCNPSLPNSLRRILLAEVPTMAIDKVFLFNNTSIIQDEVLCSRIGLIPLKADPTFFKMANPDQDPSEEDTLVYELKVKCTHKANNLPESSDPTLLYNNSSVYSDQIKWIPFGESQASKLTMESVSPVHNDILIAKLRPGHEIDMKMHAVKSIGKDHVKFSPVAVASYRLLPEIKLKSKIFGEKAVRLQKCFSKGTILLHRNKEGKTIAKVGDARYDACNRNIFQYEDLKNEVEISKVFDHFIFNIESTGAYKSSDLFTEAIKVLKNKCEVLIKLMD